jgi:hypothetical protein
MASVASVFCRIMASPCYAKSPAGLRSRDASAIALGQAADGKGIVPICSGGGTTADIPELVAFSHQPSNPFLRIPPATDQPSSGNHEDGNVNSVTYVRQKLLCGAGIEGRSSKCEKLDIFQPSGP